MENMIEEYLVDDASTEIKNDEKTDEILDEEDYDVEASNKENVTVKREFKTRKEQFEKIVDFMKDYNEQLTDRMAYKELWDKLCDELNLIGPPRHSSVQWKKIWSDYKCKSMRQSKNLSDLGTARQDTQFCLSAISEKLDIVIENQDVLIQTQNIIAEKLAKSNMLLEKIANK